MSSQTSSSIQHLSHWHNELGRSHLFRTAPQLHQQAIKCPSCWYEAKRPGGSLFFQCSRQELTILTHFRSGHLRTLTFRDDNKVFPTCVRCSACQASLDCLGLSKQASTNYILQQFSQYGNIVEHKLSPSGNWMHLRYQSKLQAKKALSKNGKVFSGNIMIGVKPCIEMDVMESCKDNSIKETSLISASNSLTTDPLEPTKPNLKNIRPLTQAYQSPNAQAQVNPVKSSGLVSKAFEYIWKIH
ncbi:UNVERIFIED_CONTAM: Nucleoporin [Trichonephila clavipes]